MCYYGNHLAVSEVSNVYNIHWSDDAGVSWNQSPGGSPVITDMKFSPEGILYGIFPNGSYSSGLWYSEDFGNTWDVEFWDTNMRAIGFDVFGHIFVGWDSPVSGNEGIAYYNPDAAPLGLTFYNDGLSNTSINKINVNPNISAPALFICTEGGVYYSYDLMVGTQTLYENKSHIDIFPNPAPSSGMVNVSMPETCENIQIQLYNTNGEEVFEWIFDDYNLVQYFQFRLPNIKAGIYYVQCNSNKGNVVKKLIIQ
jgi:hypothetical protein